MHGERTGNMQKAAAKIIASSTAGNLVCAASGRISTTQGTALEILERSAKKENNASLIEKVFASGHQSTIEHAMFTVAFDSVSVCTEEFVIEYRLASYTVQSRRYVDYSQTGFYLPELPEHLREPFSAHMQSLFDDYAKLLQLDIPKEDARFVLPYCFRSNFYCTMNARELLHMIATMLWGRGSVFPELKALGESLKAQFSEYFPNLLDSMAKKYQAQAARCALPDALPAIPDPKPAEAETVLQDASREAEQIVLEAAASNFAVLPDHAPELREIVLGGRPRELELVQARFAIRRLSLAAVTHLVRHRMQSVLVPQVTQAVLTNTYLLPESVKASAEASAIFTAAFARNAEMLRSLLADGLPVWAVQYFAMAGNQIDVLCCMNGRELRHFFALRTCTRAQWEIRACAVSLLRQLRKVSPALYSLMGPSCYVTGVCPEGKLSCGRAAEMRKLFSEESC